MSTRDDVSAGGVVCRRSEAGGLEVALIAIHGGERWALPKGLVRKAESLEDGARREVREETGLDAEIVAPLAPIDYWFWWTHGERKVRHHKVVHFFLMSFLGGNLADHDDEVDEARWFPLEDAITRLTYDSERGVLREAAGIAEGALAREGNPHSERSEES